MRWAISLGVLVSCGLVVYYALLARSGEHEVWATWSPATGEGITYFPATRVLADAAPDGTVSVPFCFGIWDPRVHDVTVTVTDPSGAAVTQVTQPVTNYQAAGGLRVGRLDDLAARVASYGFTVRDRRGQLASGSGRLTTEGSARSRGGLSSFATTAIALCTAVLELAAQVVPRVRDRSSRPGAA